MKLRHFHRWWLAALLVAAALAIPRLSQADDPNLELRGTEELHAIVVLTPTAKATPNVAGLAMIAAEDQQGVVTAHLDFQFQSLPSGPYSIGIIKKSDTNTLVVLGVFNFNTATNLHFSSQSAPGMTPLPTEFDPLDVGAILVADADGTRILTGDLLDGSSVMNGVFKARVSAVAGTAAPEANGIVYTRSNTSNGIRTTRFKLYAKGIVPNATLTLKINGIEYGTVNTDTNGVLKLQSLPKGIDAESILWMELDDSAGSNALSVSF